MNCLNLFLMPDLVHAMQIVISVVCVDIKECCESQVKWSFWIPFP